MLRLACFCFCFIFVNSHSAILFVIIFFWRIASYCAVHLRENEGGERGELAL